MPYHHPVAVSLSVVWWGVFCGCSGGIAVALLGMALERAPYPPPGKPEGEGKPPTGGSSPAPRPADSSP
jgi:hypothetical protein